MIDKQRLIESFEHAIKKEKELNQRVQSDYLKAFSDGVLAELSETLNRVKSGYYDIKS